MKHGIFKYCIHKTLESNELWRRIGCIIVFGEAKICRIDYRISYEN